MIHELENSYEDPVDHDAPALPTPLSKIDPPYAYRDHSLNYRKILLFNIIIFLCVLISIFKFY